jgi:restriction system protein
MGRFYYYTEISHKGLNKYRVIKAESKYELEQKKNAILAQWNEQWKRMKERERRAAELAAKKAERERILKNDEESALYADEQTKQAEKVQADMDALLVHSLSEKPFDFDDLKDHSAFTEPCPVNRKLFAIPTEPKITDPNYNPEPTFFTKISKKKMTRFNENNKAVFESDHTAWEKEKNVIESKNLRIRQQDQLAKKEWTARKDSFYQTQREHNKEIDDFRQLCISGDPDSVARYYSIMLDEAEFPIEFNRSVETEYKPESNVLIVEYRLPSVENIPNLKAVKYFKTKKEFRQSTFPESYIKNKYDSVVYQIILVLIKKIFTQVEGLPPIDIATINGSIETVDRSTGKVINPCILSISVPRSGFEDLNLEAIDPKAWFRKAKGISAASLTFETPVAPIMSFSREDKRFIEGYNVVDSLETGVNLAAIDWQDFENLIRELFEKEFSSKGGEVKITQASRDGGVDAVAFDPDPIRGGKIVIQAKRYTNVVGVSAVRDLYGTVLHEGAIKGILITTSYFGKDAYEFANEKPLSLMDGGYLLSLLEKHGYNARIDLQEAKNMLKQ